MSKIAAQLLYGPVLVLNLSHSLLIFRILFNLNVNVMLKTSPIKIYLEQAGPQRAMLTLTLFKFDLIL